MVWEFNNRKSLKENPHWICLTWVCDHKLCSSDFFQGFFVGCFFYLRGIFGNIFCNCPHNTSAMNTSNALPQNRYMLAVCCSRPAVSLSNHEVGPDVLIGCPTCLSVCLSVYLLGYPRTLILCTHRSLSQVLAAPSLNLAGQSCVLGEWLPGEVWARRSCLLLEYPAKIQCLCDIIRRDPGN